MAAYNKLQDYLAIDGVVLTGYLFQVDIRPSVRSVEYTAGSEKYVSRYPTIKDFTLNFSIRYETTKERVLLPLLAPGVHMILYGIRGNTVGMPKHMQKFLFTEAPIVGGNVNATEKRYFQITAQGAEAPIYNMFDNDTF